MKATIAAATLAIGLTLAVQAEAKPLSIDIKMADYSGRQAYLVAYLVNAKGQYVSTLYTAGSSGRYFEHFDRWFRMFQRARGQVDGTTGASMGAGAATTVTIEVPDSAFNAGNTLRLESAVENQYYVPDEVAVPLEDAQNGKGNAGKQYVSTLTLSF